MLTAASAAALIALAVAAAPANASDGTFDRAWGFDVVSGGGTGFEICTVASTCTFGNAGGGGGQFDSPSDVATDTFGNAYVADTDNNRIERFGGAGNFDRAWGRDVIAGGGTGFEICVPANGDVCKAGISGSGAGSMNSPTGVAVLKGNLGDFVLVADNANNRVEQYSAAGSFLRAWGKDVINGGGTGFEICVAGVDLCKAGTTGGLGGEMSGPRGIAVDNAARVYVSEFTGHRIQRFAALSGAWQRAWGKDVISTGGTAFEICTPSTDPCKTGSGSGDLGGEMFNPRGLATDSANNVYLAEWGQSRIQKFDDSGGFISAWGRNVIATGPNNVNGFEVCINGVNTCKEGESGFLGGETAFPSDVAVDQNNDVYVADSNANRIQKYGSIGTFLRAWGRDVVASGPHNTGGAEICIAGIDVCKQGVGASLGGELNSPQGVATNAAGDLYAAEADNRVQLFTSFVPGGGGGGTGGGAGGGSAGAAGGGTTVPGSTLTGQQAAALKKCKKKFKKNKSKPAFKKCKKKAKKLPL